MVAFYHGKNMPGLAQEDARVKGREDPDFLDDTWKTETLTQENLLRIIP